MIVKVIGFANFLREADGGGAGGAASGGDGGGAAAANPLAAAAASKLAGGDQGDENNQNDPSANGDGSDPNDQGNNQSTAYFPDGLPEEFRGENERETLDKLAGEFANRPKPPEKADDYEISLDDKMKEKFGDLKDDPVLPLWRETAHELGLSNEQFNGAFTKLYTRMQDAGVLEDAIDIEGELKKLEGSEGDAVAREQHAARRVNEVTTWANGLVSRHKFSEGEAAEIERLGATANGVMALEKLMTLTGEKGFPGGGTPVDTSDTKESLTALMKDERYNLRGPKGDAQFVADVDARWRRLHGVR